MTDILRADLRAHDAAIAPYDAITVRNREYRHGAAPDITLDATGGALPDSDRPRLLMRGRHTVTAITRPARR